MITDFCHVQSPMVGDEAQRAVRVLLAHRGGGVRVGTHTREDDDVLLAATFERKKL